MKTFLATITFGNIFTKGCDPKILAGLTQIPSVHQLDVDEHGNARIAIQLNEPDEHMALVDAQDAAAYIAGALARISIEVSELVDENPQEV